METDKLNRILLEITPKGKMNFIEGTSLEQIKSFEEENKISLPTQYKEWLQFSDGGELFLPAGIQLYGISHKPLIDINDDDKPNDQYIVIGALASGDPILSNKTDDQISIYNIEGGRIEEDEVYSDFYAFLNDLSNILGIGD